MNHQGEHQQGYLLGIGSNIQPHYHLGQIILALLEHFESITLSRVISLPPIGMNSQHDFLNTVAFVPIDCSESALKHLCNTIEIRLGRDRLDPQSKVKDRPADLDILKAIQLPQDTTLPAYTLTDEYFLYPLIEELLAYLAGQPCTLSQAGVPLHVNQLVFGQTATTINRQTDTGDKRIV